MVPDGEAGLANAFRSELRNDAYAPAYLRADESRRDVFWGSVPRDAIGVRAAARA